MTVQELINKVKNEYTEAINYFEEFNNLNEIDKAYIKPILILCMLFSDIMHNRRILGEYLDLLILWEQHDAKSENSPILTFLKAIEQNDGNIEFEGEIFEKALQIMAKHYSKRGFYPVPTAIERIQHVFGEILPEIKHYSRYKCLERHYVYPNIFKEPTSIKIDIGLELEDSLAKIDREIIENTDALALKVFNAVLSECYRQNGKWGAYCYWDTNTFCDLLGYKRDKNGYHFSRNIRRVEKRLKMLSTLKYKFEILGYNKKAKIVFEAPIISIQSDSSAKFFWDNKCIAIKNGIVRIHDELYRAMINRRFAWFDNRFLKLNAQKHSRAILLYCYYACQLAMGLKQRKDKHIVKRPIDTVLRETGIVVNTEHPKRNKKSFIEAHEELKQQGLIDDFTIDWFYGDIEVVFPFDHPTINLSVTK